jgi:uncharacterized protein (DUF58 family)
MAPTAALVQPETLAKLHRLEVAARMVVEGLQTGAHRSPHKGHSVDFADHRPYVPGDDLRHLDWKVLGKSDRLVLKRYEAETDLACVLAVDGSGSMAYQGERAAMSKYRYASVLAATLGWLTMQQQDRVGLVLFAEDAAVELPPRSQQQFDRICRALEGHVPAARTDAQKGLEHLTAPTVRRGLVVLFSDLMVEPAELDRALDRVARRGHDVAVVWTLDPDELDLGVPTVSRFEGLEGESAITAEPRSLREAYAEQVRAHRAAVQKACRGRNIAFVECSTADPPQIPLNQLLVALNDDR